MCFFKLIIIKIWTELNGPDSSLHSKLFVWERRELWLNSIIELQLFWHEMCHHTVKETLSRDWLPVFFLSRQWYRRGVRIPGRGPMFARFQECPAFPHHCKLVSRPSGRSLPALSLSTSNTGLLSLGSTIPTISLIDKEARPHTSCCRCQARLSCFTSFLLVQSCPGLVKKAGGGGSKIILT